MLACQRSDANDRRSACATSDGFVVPVPKKKLPAYRRMAQKAGKIWKEHGALEFRECVADDVKVGQADLVSRAA